MENCKSLLSTEAIPMLLCAARNTTFLREYIYCMNRLMKYSLSYFSHFFEYHALCKQKTVDICKSISVASLCKGVAMERKLEPRTGFLPVAGGYYLWYQSSPDTATEGPTSLLGRVLMERVIELINKPPGGAVRGETSTAGGPAPSPPE